MREISPRSPLAILLMGLVFGYAGILLVAPIYAIVDGALADGLQPVRESLQDPNTRHAIQLSFRLSLYATVFNLVFGLILSWVMVRHDFRGKRLMNALIDIPFVFSPVIAGYVMIVLFGREGWVSLPFAVVFALPGMFLGKVFVSLPFVARETIPVLSAMPPQQEEVAYTLGASRWRTFWEVVLPVIWTAVLYGIVLSFARAIGEFGAVAVVSGAIEGRTETATMFVYRAFLDRNRIGSYSVALLLGILAIVILVIMELLNQSLVEQKENLSHVHQAD